MNPTKEDIILSNFLQALGPWRQHVVIGGGYAPIIYKLYLAKDDLTSFPVGTRDIDSLIPRKIPKISAKNLAEYLIESEFTQVFKNLGIPAIESYAKEIEGIEIEVEFLTDTSARKDKYKNVVIAGVVAQPLDYLTLSFQKTKPFTTFVSQEGRVVSPEAWVFHKGLTFNKRKQKTKFYKDLYGIWYVTSQLGDFSEETISLFHRLGGEHPKWLNRFKLQLNRWLTKATPLEWMKLESQDPSGKLKKLSFRQVVGKLCAGFF